MATRRTLFIANWKMHNNVQQASHFLYRLGKRMPHIPRKSEVVICPSFVALQPLARQLRDSSIRLGAQNVHYADEGTHTGEVSALMLKGIVDYVIIGHSERRAQFGEKDDVIAKKVAAAVRNEITPILCIGETYNDRQEGMTNRVLHDQLVGALSLITPEELMNVGLVVAYEPVWAISKGDGKGQHAKPEDIEKAIDRLHTTIKELYGQPSSTNVRYVYGGSTNPDNVKAYLKTKGVEGFLIGGASLNYQQFASMIEATKG